MSDDDRVLLILGKRISDRPEDRRWELYQYSIYVRGRMYFFHDKPINEQRMALRAFIDAYPIKPEVFEVSRSDAPTLAAIREFTKKWKQQNPIYETWGSNSQLYAKDFLHNLFNVKICTQTLQKVDRLRIILIVFVVVNFLIVAWGTKVKFDNWALLRANEEENKAVRRSQALYRSFNT